MSPVNVGERIRQLRLGLGMSLRTLATKTISPSLAFSGGTQPGQHSPIRWLEHRHGPGDHLGQFFASQSPAP